MDLAHVHLLLNHFPVIGGLKPGCAVSLRECFYGRISVYNSDLS